MSEWISVSDRLPDWEKPVIAAARVFREERGVRSSRLEVTVAMRSQWRAGSETEWGDILDTEWDGGTLPLFNVEYWMPLPVPPT